jgi:hypothetical protein
MLEVSVVDDLLLKLFLKIITTPSLAQLFFINLGGYKENEFEEYHYKMLAVANKLVFGNKKI